MLLSLPLSQEDKVFLDIPAYDEIVYSRLQRPKCFTHPIGGIRMNAIQRAKMCGLRGGGVWRLMASVLLAAVLLTPLHAHGFQCPPEDIIATQCQGPKDCLYANPDDCGSFIQCTVLPGGTSGAPVVKPCPAGLHWNSRDGICDWPANGDCANPHQEDQPDQSDQ